MTVSNFGQIMPLQGHMLFMAGYGPSKSEGSRGLEMPDDLNGRVENILVGRTRLIATTGHDFDVSLSDWHNALLGDPNFAAKYRFARAWRAVEKAILEQINNPDRKQVEALAKAALVGENPVFDR